ncbi:matrixin family metalloprotease [Chondromyces apiculatus]|uniref:Putative aminopeptidase n=1 Tax=Chondromyces apiculatus DSM 436 TaxID=1192034 RepID=A0A017SYZ3_9BACT|nr:M57 family metalloprotease [Chondromyces apiculatus]EYF01835.1 putative aminopeptidase [Chondromyces apiculatus DSM 436]
MISAGSKKSGGLILKLALVACSATLAGVGCVADVGDEGVEEVGTNQMSWEEFRASVFQEEESGVFIVNGDEMIADVKLLREFYEQHVRDGALIVHRVGSADAKWNDTQKLNITYCVSTTFNGNYNAVVAAMNSATTAWENVANVNFVHSSNLDSNCTASQSGVVFDVRPVNVGGQYLARAFFPNDARSARNVLIDNTAFGSSGDPSLTGILRHELGHTLGFRHEHTRPESGTCFEDNNWRALTTYDQSSVMHYPQCNGISSWALNISTKDAQGAAALYGAPGGGGSGGSGGSGGGATTENLTGSVAAGVFSHLGYADVKPGTAFTASMTGTGDPDLYVRWTSQPTTTAYTCRPYLSGATESCNLTVPAGITKAYVSVRGYSAGTYNLNVTYTAP